MMQAERAQCACDHEQHVSTSIASAPASSPQQQHFRHHSIPLRGVGPLYCQLHCHPRSSLIAYLQKVDLANNFSEDPNHTDTRPQPSPHPSEDSTTFRKKDKSFRNPLTRSRSIRSDSQSKSRKPSGLYPPPPEQPPNSAPLSTDWPQNDMGFFSKSKGSNQRGKSADRALTDESDENTPLPNRNMPTKEHKEKSNAFVSGGKNVLGKAKSGGGMFLSRLGKIGRSSSNGEKDIPDAEYKLKVINQPLIEQTRATRISKRIEASKDKTEYWMPSLPWRCIE
jgi:hypothetical protein